MRPDFQAHERNPDVQGSVKLKTHTESHGISCEHHPEIYMPLPRLGIQSGSQISLWHMPPPGMGGDRGCESHFSGESSETLRKMANVVQAELGSLSLEEG